MDVAWRDVPHPPTIHTRVERHLAGRDLTVEILDGSSRWHWYVRSPRRRILASGVAASRPDAERAAELEATAVHPPSEAWIEELVS